MRYQDIQTGVEYGIRLKVAAGEPLLHVLVLDKVARNKQLKLRHLEGDSAGMEEFLPFRHVAIPWKERKAFLHDEELLQAVMARSWEQWDRVTADAMDIVWEATGEVGFNLHGHLSVYPPELERVLARARLSVTIQDLGGFVDRNGRAQIPFDGALRVATAFADSEPDSVTMTIGTEEEQYRAEGYGESFWHDELRKRRPAFALARQWAGFESELARLRDEIQRLRNLCSGWRLATYARPSIAGRRTA